jgi:hypothetical protein
MFEVEVNRIAGEIALLSSEPDAAKAEAHFVRALTVARAQQGQVLGIARSDEHGAALARSGQAAAISRTARSRSLVGLLKALIRPT